MNGTERAREAHALASVELVQPTFLPRNPGPLSFSIRLEALNLERRSGRLEVLHEHEQSIFRWVLVDLPRHVCRPKDRAAHVATVLRGERNGSRPCDASAQPLPLSQHFSQLSGSPAGALGRSAPRGKGVATRFVGSGRTESLRVGSLPCRRSWVRVPSSAPRNPLETAGFSISSRQAHQATGSPSQPLVSLAGVQEGPGPTPLTRGSRTVNPRGAYSGRVAEEPDGGSPARPRLSA
jgi:hypothetical protein